jgi:hypothetical protein
MRFSRAAVLSACATHGVSAWAVDGVGLGEMFPGLALIVWATLVAIATSVAYRIVRSGDEQRRKRQFRYFAAAAVVLFGAPYAYSFAGKSYAVQLCSTNAETSVLITPEQWRSRKRNPSKDTKRPVLFESRKVERFNLGVWGQTHYLIDPLTNESLMVSTAYFSSRISKPYGCGGNERYWTARQEFAKVAQIEYKP